MNDKIAKKEGCFMLKELKYILTALIIIIAAYGFATNNIYQIIHVMMLFLSLLTLVRGIESFQKKDNLNGWLNIALFLFLLFVSIQGLMLRYVIV